MHHQDIIAFSRTGQWQKQLFGEELSDNDRLLHARSKMLLVRVRDEATRQMVETVNTHAMNSARSADQSESERALIAMSKNFEALNDRIGGLLRKLDEDETA